MNADDETRSVPGHKTANKDESSLGGLSEVLGLGPVEPSHDPLIGMDIGGVTLVRVIAEGGMGRVYEGLQDKPRRPVAVKVMRPGFVSKDVCRRFDNEAEVLGRLQHPYIAQIFSASICHVVGAQVPYFVMEYIADALPLTAYAKQHSLSTHQRLELFHKVCEAVAHGHEKGVIHRDLKPSNILVEPKGHPKVIDFGISRSIDSLPEQMTAVTDIGQLIGTVQYMSPEQFAADPNNVDQRSDVYALGVILYELLAGQPPYEISHRQILAAAEVVRHRKPPSLASLNRNVRPEIEQVAGKCLHKNKEKRFANAAELASAIGDCKAATGRLNTGKLPRVMPALTAPRLSFQRGSLALAGAAWMLLWFAGFYYGYGSIGMHAKKVWDDFGVELPQSHFFAVAAWELGLPAILCLGLLFFVTIEIFAVERSLRTVLFASGLFLSLSLYLALMLFCLVGSLMPQLLRLLQDLS